MAFCRSSLLAALAPLALAGCATSLQPKLDAMRQPGALPGSREGLSPGQRRALFEDHRARLNGLGAQVGRRHLAVAGLEDYFRRSGLEPFAVMTTQARWSEKAEAKRDEIARPYAAFDGPLAGHDPASAALGLAAMLAVNVVSLAAQKASRQAAQAELVELERRAQGFKGSTADLLESYNRWLALDLGISPTAEVVSARKPRLPDLPAAIELSANRSLDDWAEDYALGPAQGSWYFGYERCEHMEVFKKYLGYRSGTLYPLGPSSALKMLAFLGYVASGILVTYGAQIEAGTYDTDTFSGNKKERPANGALLMAGGAAALATGLTIQWGAAKKRDSEVAAFNRGMRARLEALPRFGAAP